MKFKARRKEALEAGDKFYMTNKPCKYGHYAKRLTVDGQCTECITERRRKERETFKALRSSENA